MDLLGTRVAYAVTIVPMASFCQGLVSSVRGTSARRINEWPCASTASAILLRGGWTMDAAQNRTGPERRPISGKSTADYADDTDFFFSFRVIRG